MKINRFEDLDCWQAKPVTLLIAFMGFVARTSLKENIALLIK